jgi:hypothetical protein
MIFGGQPRSCPSVGASSLPSRSQASSRSGETCAALAASSSFTFARFRAQRSSAGLTNALMAGISTTPFGRRYPVLRAKTIHFPAA